MPTLAKTAFSRVKTKYGKPRKKVKTAQKLIKDLDKAFSLFIRARDQEKPCIDLCNRPGTHQAGHFRVRGRHSTRFHPKNVNGQNEFCNKWANDTYRHAKGIDERWGAGTAEKLERLSKLEKQWRKKELVHLIQVLKERPEDYEKEYEQIAAPQTNAFLKQ